MKNSADRGDAIEGQLAYQKEILPKEFSIGYSGDWNVTAALIAGADAWYSVLGGILPEPCLGIVRAARHGDHTEVHGLDATLARCGSFLKRSRAFALSTLSQSSSKSVPPSPHGQSSRFPLPRSTRSPKSRPV